MKPRRIPLVSLFAVTALALTACGNPTPHHSTASSGSPRPTHSATPTPTPTPVPLVAAKVQLTHDGLTVVSTTNVTMGQVPFSEDPTQAVHDLGVLIGSAAPINNFPAGQCSTDYSTAVWGSSNALLLQWNTSASERDSTSQWDASTRSPNIGSIVVGTPAGFKVGDSASAYLAGTPWAVSMFGGQEIYYGLDANNTGVMASIDNGQVFVIEAPVNVNHDC